MNLLSLDRVWFRQFSYCWMVFSSSCLTWYCVMRSMLCSRRMLFGCINSSIFRHCCIVPCGTCHWHKYILVIACAPHLSFLVVVCFIMVWRVWPTILV